MSDQPSKHTELLLLCGKVRDDAITPEDAARLDALLQESDSAKALYVQYMSVLSLLESRGVGDRSGESDEAASNAIEHDVLAELLHLESKAKVQLVQPPATLHLHANRVNTPWHLGGALRYLANQPATWAAAAAVLALALVLITLLPGPAGPNTPPSTAAKQTPPTPTTLTVATLTAQHNATWAEGASAPGSNPGSKPKSPPRPGDALAAGQRLTLTQGFAEITTARGAVAILEAPATIELLDNANALRLHAGKMVGICQTQSSKGFLVRTPHMDITDLGTEFGVDMTSDLVTATVFTGEVSILTPDGAQQTLTAQQTASLTVNGNNRELVVEERIAAGFEALREQQALHTATLPGTGVGLSPGEYSADWHVTAIDGQLLDSPLPMMVSRDAKPVAVDDPLAPSQMLLRSLRDHGGRNALFQMETTLRLPAGFDPAAEQLAVRFRVDNVFKSLRINGQTIHVSPEQRTAQGNYYAVTIQAPLRPGDNQITFEIINEGENDIYNPAGVQVAWELEPVPTQKP